MIFDTRTIRELNLFSFRKRYLNRLFILAILSITPTSLALLYSYNIIIYFIALAISSSLFLFYIIGPWFRSVIMISLFSAYDSGRSEKEKLLRQIDFIRHRVKEQMHEMEFDSYSRKLYQKKNYDLDFLAKKNMQLLKELDKMENSLNTQKFTKASIKLLSDILKILEQF